MDTVKVVDHLAKEERVLKSALVKATGKIEKADKQATEVKAVGIGLGLAESILMLAYVEPEVEMLEPGKAKEQLLRSFEIYKRILNKKAVKALKREIPNLPMVSMARRSTGPPPPPPPAPLPQQE